LDFETAKVILFNKGYAENFFFPLIFLEEKNVQTKVKFVSEQQLSFVV